MDFSFLATIVGYIAANGPRKEPKPKNDNFLLITNFDDYFPAGTAVGKIARKCLKLAPRSYWLCGGGDAIISGVPIPFWFRLYVWVISRCWPKVFYIENLSTDPLSLVEAIMQDEELCKKLSAFCKESGLKLLPLISTPQTFDLSKKLDIEIMGTCEELVREGLISRLNSKIHFCEWMLEHDYETGCAPCYDMHSVEAQIRAICSTGAQATVREDESAGGLGNGTYASIAEFFQETRNMSSRQKQAFKAVVGPYQNGLDHYSFTWDITDSDWHYLGLCERKIVNQTESAGGHFACSKDSDALREAKDTALAYIAYVHGLGYRGKIDIDFGIRHCDQKVFYFESNARILLTNIQIRLLRLFEESLGEGTEVFYTETGTSSGRLGTMMLLLASLWTYLIGKVTGSMTYFLLISPPDHEHHGWFSSAHVGVGADGVNKSLDRARQFLSF